jgi:hypothetical protein
VFEFSYSVNIWHPESGINISLTSSPFHPLTISSIACHDPEFTFNGMDDRHCALVKESGFVFINRSGEIAGDDGDESPHRRAARYLF